jgi:hypothetical protein
MPWAGAIWIYDQIDDPDDSFLQVRWRVLRAMPAVSEVLVHIKTDEVLCPLSSELRPQNEIEHDIRHEVGP